VLLPGMEAEDPEGFLGLYSPVRFSSLEDEDAFTRLMSGIFVSKLGERQTPLFKADALDHDFAVVVCRR
jgi:hypothetical protein